MGKPLRALIVDDVEADALLVVRELRCGGFQVTFERVDTPEAMAAALAKQVWDVVISDHSMPRFSAPLALALLKERKLDLPFILVSGTVGEDIVVEALHAGAHDFMAKDKLARLNPAIERELRDTALRAERSKMQEQLIISDRMASLGILAAGVAHEINNPLAAVMANLAFVAADVAKLALELRMPDGAADDASTEWIATRLHTMEDSLRDARESADRVRLIVRDLKIFSRADEEKTGAVDVRRVIESSLRMAWNEIRHRARLVKEYGNISAVEGNEARLGQVFLNLIVNAAQAIPEGLAEGNEIRVVTKQDGQGRVVVEVRDTGSGIPESVISRIFDPFFTTKTIGEGTGLGLAICHRIVIGLGGELAVESQLGKGTTFRIVLPAAKSAVVRPGPATPVASVSRRARILIVDDEPMLGKAVLRMLSPEHDVVAVTAARDGIARVLGQPFDVIICDLMMPEVSGMDLHAELARFAPDQAERVVFMTGGAFTSRAREFLDRVRNPRIEKPFDEGSIKALIYGMLR
ncbi:MAG: response regulator [Deltaproteobacteria bacterium]|nr:response regulator [Deltaproteobacteria bacterium]